MIPIGYRTIPEALTFISLKASERSPFEWLDAALADGLLRVYVLEPAQYTVDIMRIPHEEVTQMRSTGWNSWLPGGRVPKQPERKTNPEYLDWLYKNRTGPEPPQILEPPNFNLVLWRYSEKTLLIEDAELDRWCNAWLAPAPQTLIAKTGAPGRPTSMPIVLAEFERRRANKKCKPSREAEAAALVAWFKEMHPNMPVPTAKTIRNKLPQDFQPFSERRPK